MLAHLLHLIALAWAHREHAVASVAAFLVAYMTLPAATRERIEARSPRWRATVGLLRDVFPFLPGVPAHTRAIIAGTAQSPVPMPTSSVTPAAPDAPAAPTRADELDLRATVAPPPPAIAPSPLRAPTLTGVADVDEARYEAARRYVAASVRLTPAHARELAALLTRYADTHAETPE